MSLGGIHHATISQSESTVLQPYAVEPMMVSYITLPGIQVGGLILPCDLSLSMMLLTGVPCSKVLHNHNIYPHCEGYLMV